MSRAQPNRNRSAPSQSIPTSIMAGVAQSADQDSPTPVLLALAQNLASRLDHVEPDKGAPGLVMAFLEVCDRLGWDGGELTERPALEVLSDLGGPSLRNSS